MLLLKSAMWSWLGGCLCGARMGLFCFVEDFLVSSTLALNLGMLENVYHVFMNTTAFDINRSLVAAI